MIVIVLFLQHILSVLEKLNHLNLDKPTAAEYMYNIYIYPGQTTPFFSCYVLLTSFYLFDIGQLH